MFLPLRDDNPRETFPFVTLTLIAVNVLVQLYQLTMSPERVAVFLRQTGAIPLEITTLTDLVRFPDHPVALLPVPLTLFTAMFVHGGWLHLIGNMWYLWLFGDNIEDRLGHLRFLLFYLLVGLIASLLQVLANPTEAAPMVGASGAIAGILGAYALLFPRARIITLLFIIIIIQLIEVPAIVVLGFWFVLQLVQSIATGELGGVAWFAHIGGFLAGLLLVKLFVRQDWRQHKRPRF